MLFYRNNKSNYQESKNRIIHVFPAQWTQPNHAYIIVGTELNGHIQDVAHVIVVSN